MSAIEHGCYLPAPINGGPLDTAPPKIGEWAWQPKVDDWRAKLHVPSQTLWNQYGKLSTVAQQGKLNVALGWIASLVPNTVEWLDCGIMENRHDLMRGCIIVFDWIEALVPQFARYGVLELFFPTLPIDIPRFIRETGGQIRDSVYLIQQWDNGIEPMKLYAKLQQDNAVIGHKFYEGLVAKQKWSKYPTSNQSPKMPCSSWIKHRFDQ